MTTAYSSILCVADINITDALDRCLSDLALPEVFVQRAKQMSLADKAGFLGLRPVTKLEESRALLYRFFVPAEYETGVMGRVAEAADLKTGGRGCICSQRIASLRGTPLAFDTEKLERLCGKPEPSPPENYAVVCCTIPRGAGNSLAEAVLELGVCVPVVFFGEGVGLRDKLGLMRITIPAEKEIIWFIVPRQDAELVEKTLIPRARLDIPGQGFLYKFFVYAVVVNLRIRHGKRVHAATMEQVIAAMDEVRGSSDWRRLGSRKRESSGGTCNARGLFFIGEEDDVEIFRGTAMETGARGATLNKVEMRSYSGSAHEHGMVSNSRNLCDIITTSEIESKLTESFAGTELFKSGSTCVLKTFDVEMAPVIRSQGFRV